MSKMPDSGKGHRDAELIARRDAVLILDASARLNDRANSRFVRGLDRVAKRKERVAHHDAIADLAARFFSTLCARGTASALSASMRLGWPWPAPTS